MNIEDVLKSQYFSEDPGLSSWLHHVEDEFTRPYICHLREFLRKACAAGEAIYPDAQKVFAALSATPLHRVKAVIVGQDPYPNGQADGLAFSMSRRLGGGRSWGSSSLRAVLDAVNEDFDSKIPLDGSRCNLGSWASAGVLLLNSVLSVGQEAGSHYYNGWEQLTDRIIEVVGSHKRGVVFLLCGEEAKRKRVMIDTNRGHSILCAPHPTREGRKGFREAKLFSKANDHLRSGGMEGIDWTAGLLDQGSAG